MKVDLWVFLGLGLGLSLVSCGGSILPPQEMTTIDITCNDICENIELTDFFQVNLIPLETNIESHIRVIDKIVLADSFFLIGDQFLDKILLFNSDGVFIKALLPVPQPGPGEFNMVRDIDYQSDTIYLNDFRRILKYDINLNWYETKKLLHPADRIAVTDDALYCFGYNQGLDDFVRLYSYSKDLSWPPEAIMTEKRKLGRMRLRQPLNLLKSKDNLLFTTFYLDTIYSVNNKSQIPKYLINFTDRKFASNYYDDIPLGKSPIQVFNEINGTKFAHKIINFVDQDDFVFFQFVLDNEGVSVFRFKDSGKIILSHQLLLNGMPIGTRLNGFCDGRAIFCLEPNEISKIIIAQNPAFQNGFDEYSNPVLMELTLRDEQ